MSGNGETGGGATWLVVAMVRQGEELEAGSGNSD